MQDYFKTINEELQTIYSIAEKARKQGLDPSLKVEIPIAKDIADRVEGLIGPEGVGDRIRDLESKNLSREQVAFKIAEEICDKKLIEGTKEVLAEQAIRTSLAVITESITAAPIEGIAKVKIKKNDDGSDYLAVYYSGPIRSAGGTAAGMSVLLADFIRKKLGIGKYIPDQREIERYVEELELYNRVSHLQLPTTKEEQRFAAQHLTIEISGEPTDKVEVSGNRDLRRIETNRLRGGACLVFNDGLVGRAKKLSKRILENKLDGWDWFDKLIEIHEHSGSAIDEDVTDSYDVEDEDEVKDEIEEDEITSDDEIIADVGYIKDVIGGRPVFAHPSEQGGFRLRYGRSRATGLAGMGIHPALMGLVDDFLACGTHVRTERPGKGAIVMPVNSIHPPIVKLKNGDVVKVQSYKEAKTIHSKLDEILFLGDMLYGVGEFNQNNFDLIPSGYCEEWWVQELEEAFMDLKDKAGGKIDIKLEDKIKLYVQKPLEKIPSSKEAIELSRKLKIPLHPEYTYHWSTLSIDDFYKLRDYIEKNIGEQVEKLEITYNDEIKNLLECICIPHSVEDDKIAFNSHSLPLIVSLGLRNSETKVAKRKKNGKTIEFINLYSDIKIRDKCPIYTGARMGRPEKAKDRRMRPPVNMLFPIGDAGGRLRDLFVAAAKRKIDTELTRRKCPSCGIITHRVLCSNCNVPTELSRLCSYCGKETDLERCDKCDRDTQAYVLSNIDLDSLVNQAKIKLGAPIPKKVKAVKKLMNKLRAPELLEKGILRSKHNLFVYRDGTIRFDSTDAALTHFKPSEIGITVKQLHELGYTVDVHGKTLEQPSQVVELKIQDIVLNDDGGNHLVRVAQFIDELLEKVYNLPKYYNAKKPSDLVGNIVVGLAPHTSAGIVGRIIGFTKAKVNFAHPYWHAAKRRNCLSGSEEILIWDNNKGHILRKSLSEIIEGQIRDGANQEIVDDFGTLAIENLNPNWQAFSIDENTKQPIFQDIKHWIKGKSKHWIEIRTSSGRTMRMTPNHNALVWNSTSNIITKTKASNLEVGDYIPVVRNPPIPAVQPSKQINILKEFSNNLPDEIRFHEFKHKVRLRDAASWMRERLLQFPKNHELFGKIKASKRIPSSLRAYLIELLPTKPVKNLLDSNWFASIPLSHLEVLQQEGIFDWEEIPRDAKIGMARDDKAVSPYIEFSQDLMRLMGYLIAEGYIRDERTCYQTNFSVPNPDLRDHVWRLIEDVLDSEPYYKKDNHQLVHTGRIHAYLFAYAFGIGKGAYTKRLPYFIYSLPSKYKYALLSAYIDGDGSIPSTDNSILIYSVSKDLLDDVSLLLNTVGIFCRARKPSPPGHYGKKIINRYEELKKVPKKSIVHRISIRGPDLKIIEKLAFINSKKKENAQRIKNEGYAKERIIRKNNGKYTKIEETTDLLYDPIVEISKISSNKPSYCLEILSKPEKPTFHNFATRSLLVTVNCDGDEDSVLLALDAFLNFSKSYLPEIRGGKMDAPLILVANLNPHEVDDESHNVDTCSKYPLSFYEATLEGVSPKIVLPLIDMISNRLSDESAYEGFYYSHETSKIFDGPESTAYKNLKTMSDKVYAQLDVASLVRAVNIDDVATRVIVNHFVPDMIGNLRRFGSQKIRCTKCNRTYRRIPLKGICPNCGEAKLNLTVFQKSVSKYYNMAENLVNEYNLSEYLKNRLAVIKHNMESLFSEAEVSADLSERTEKTKESVQLRDFFLKHNSGKE